MELPKRKPTRLRGYDYSEEGAYFITICTHNRKCLLSNIVGDGVLDVPQNELTSYGQIAEKIIIQLNEFYNYISVDKYVIMPNHIHLLLSVTDSNGTSRTPSPTEFTSILSTYFYDHKRLSHNCGSLLLTFLFVIFNFPFVFPVYVYHFSVKP